MEKNRGPGGYAAVLAHGGITAVVRIAGEVQVGDDVIALHESDEWPEL